MRQMISLTEAELYMIEKLLIENESIDIENDPIAMNILKKIYAARKRNKLIKK